MSQSTYSVWYYSDAKIDPPQGSMDTSLVRSQILFATCTLIIPEENKKTLLMLVTSRHLPKKFACTQHDEQKTIKSQMRSYALCPDSDNGEGLQERKILSSILSVHCAKEWKQAAQLVFGPYRLDSNCNLAILSVLAPSWQCKRVPKTRLAIWWSWLSIIDYSNVYDHHLS